MSDYIIKTSRLGLRNWIESDIEPANIMNANSKVREFFPNTLSKEETIRFIRQMQAHFDKYGFCYFAVDRLDTKEFIGFIGLMNQTYQTSFTPFVDIGWRLLQNAWRNGFATEGAKACLDYAFAELKLTKVYAIAPELNKKSQHIMQKLGMEIYTHFEYPKLDKNSPLRKCVAYRIKSKNY